MRKPYHFTTQNPRFLYIDHVRSSPFLTGGVPWLRLSLKHTHRIDKDCSRIFSTLYHTGSFVLLAEPGRFIWLHAVTAEFPNTEEFPVSIIIATPELPRLGEGASEVLGPFVRWQVLLSPRSRLACGLLARGLLSDAPFYSL